MDKQHVQLPNSMTQAGELSPKDLLVYVSIKRFLNSKTKECFPSLDKIVEKSGISKPTVRKSIEILKKLGYITVNVKGRSNYYTFNSYKTFEPFSYDFLDSDTDANIKAYIIAAQNVMFKDIKGFGKISYSDTELSKLINLDRHTIAKYNKILEEKGLLSTVKLDKKDTTSGIYINEKIFHLDELGQSIIWALQKHENDINELKEQTNNTSKDVELLLKEIESLRKEIRENKENKENPDNIII